MNPQGTNKDLSEKSGDKVAVVGSRSFTDYQLMEKTLDAVGPISTIISGGANGADMMAERYAREHGISISIHLPDWKKYGRAAGVIRNKDIIAECDRCVAFWDGSSHGTANDIELCRKLDKPCEVIRFDK